MKHPPKVLPIPVPKGNKHPDPEFYPILPTHEFTWGVISPKGAGKTTIMINLLKFYKGYFHKIIIFSPTILNDDKWDYVKTLNLRVENKQLIKFLKSLEDDKDVDDNKMFPSVEGTPKNAVEKFDPKIPEQHFITLYNEETLKGFVDEQDQMIKFLKANEKPKYLADRILFVLDDLVGSELFNGRQDNYFKVFNTIHRHLGCSAFMLSQAFKEIPKTIRTQWTCLLTFAIGSDKEIESIYEEFSMGLKKLQWYAVYDFCTKDPHSFMFVDFQKPIGQQIMKNFDTFIDEGN